MLFHANVIQLDAISEVASPAGEVANPDGAAAALEGTRFHFTCFNIFEHPLT